MSVSGKYLTARINGTVIFDNYSWTVKENSKELDRTTGAFNGFGATNAGVQRATVSIKGFMDIASGQYVQVEAGTIITELSLYRDINDALPAYTFPVCTVHDSQQGGEVDGKVEWEASNIKNYGSYTCNDP